MDSCACIFHWYSDTSEGLSRALRAGCYVSLGQAGISTRRGREYARVVPAERLLLETDLPAQGHAYEVAAVQEQLRATLERIAELRGADVGELAATVQANCRSLLGAPLVLPCAAR